MNVAKNVFQKMYRKGIILIAAGLLVTSMTACSAKKDNDTASSVSTQTEQQAGKPDSKAEENAEATKTDAANNAQKPNATNTTNTSNKN